MVATSANEYYSSTYDRPANRHSLATWESVIKDKRKTMPEPSINTLGFFYLLTEGVGAEDE